MTTPKRFLRPELALFVGIWLVLMVGGRSRFFRDPGTFWHTVVGEQMLSTGRLIYEDTFSFTFAGRPWSPHQWLGECIMAAFHRLGGLDSLLLLTVTALSCLYAWLAYRLMRAGLHWSLAGLGAALAIAASASHFHIRPHIATILFTGLTFGLLIDFDARRIACAKLWWLVPVYLLWTNLHGGMLGGLGTIGLAIVGWCLASVLRLPSPLRGEGAGVRVRGVATLIAILIACGLTALVNPYGVRLPMIWLEIMDSPILPQIIQEHSPLNPTKPDGLIVLCLALIYVFTLVGTLPRCPRVTWLLPIVWFYLACSRIRHAPLFSITAGLAIADMLPYTVWARMLARRGSDLFRFPDSSDAPGEGFSWRLILAPLGIVFLGLVLQASQLPVPLLGHGWAKLDPDYWPTQLRADLERCQRSLPAGTPIFNEYLYGGFLIYYTPGLKVLVDDRCELYGDRWLENYVRAESHDTGQRIQEWQARYPRFDLALTQTGSGFDTYFAAANDWKPVARTPTASLYERRQPTDRAAK
jgi:hypothetical protein